MRNKKSAQKAGAKILIVPYVGITQIRYGRNPCFLSACIQAPEYILIISKSLCFVKGWGAQKVYFQQRGHLGKEINSRKILCP